MKLNHRIPSSHRITYQPAHARFSNPDQKRANRRETVYRDYYARGQQQRQFRKTKISIAIIAVLLIGQSIFQVPFFRIKTIEIHGLKYTPIEQVRPFVVQELSRRRWLIFRNNNYFLLAKDLLKQRLEERYFLKVLELKKMYPSRISVSVQERISGFTIQAPEGYYSLDTKGNKIGGSTHDAPITSTVIADERSEKTAVPSVDFLEKATQIREQWDQVLPKELTLDRFHLTDDASRITVSTNRNFRIYFDPKNDIDKQLSRLAVFLKETSIERPGDHIDLRFEGNIYFK